jgi:hypothetical protein
LVELVAFEDLRESGFHRQLFAVEDGIGGSDCGGMSARRSLPSWAGRVIVHNESERVVAAQSSSGIENLQRIDR